MKTEIPKPKLVTTMPRDLREVHELQVVCWWAGVMAVKLAEAEARGQPGRRATTEAESPRMGTTEVCVRLGVSRMWIERRLRAGTFPRPHRIGARRFWWRHEVETFEAEEMANPPPTTARNLPAPPAPEPASVRARRAQDDPGGAR
jgi:predicted DNA-binding transcriptional regulator AlpA